MAATSTSQPMEVIDLCSDDDDDDDQVASNAAGPSSSPRTIPSDNMDGPRGHAALDVPLQERGPVLHPNFLENALNRTAEFRRNAGGEDIDGEGDFPVHPPDHWFPPSPATDSMTYDEDTASAASDVLAVTFDVCLQRVLEVFPDVSHDYVLEQYNDFDHELQNTALGHDACLHNILEHLLSVTDYPRREKGKHAQKRKRELSAGDGDRGKLGQEERQPHESLMMSSQLILYSEFPHIPQSRIREVLQEKKSLGPTYTVLAEMSNEFDRPHHLNPNNHPSQLNDAAAGIPDAAWLDLMKELDIARGQAERMGLVRDAEAAEKRREEENLQTGETAECSACFDDLPTNRQIHCDGPLVHFTCFDCAETYIASEIGQSRCRLLCPAGCDAGFAPQQLNLLADKSLLKKLSQIQQEKDIRDAGIENLEECPFCDFKAIVAPIDEDFEFRCLNAECEKVSCRRCKAISHTPLSCEQHAKEHKISGLHRVEEAMTAALLRSCNTCKRQFIKEYGCNKMTCPNCGNTQCYVCSKTLKGDGYAHFEDIMLRRRARGTGSKTCPLSDNVEERHAREVKEAQTATQAKVIEENPDIGAEDLEIKVSDAVKKASKKRVRGIGLARPPVVADRFGLDRLGPVRFDPERFFDEWLREELREIGFREGEREQIYGGLRNVPRNDDMFVPYEGVDYELFDNPWGGEWRPPGGQHFQGNQPPGHLQAAANVYACGQAGARNAGHQQAAGNVNAGGYAGAMNFGEVADEGPPGRRMYTPFWNFDPNPPWTGLAQEQPMQQAPMQQAPMQQAPMQQAPMQQAPTQQAPMQQASMQQATMQQAPTQQASMQQAPMQQAPTQQASMQQLPMQQPPAAPPLQPPMAHNTPFHTWFWPQTQHNQPFDPGASRVDNPVTWPPNTHGAANAINPVNVPPGPAPNAFLMASMGVPQAAVPTPQLPSNSPTTERAYGTLARQYQLQYLQQQIEHKQQWTEHKQQRTERRAQKQKELVAQQQMPQLAQQIEQQLHQHEQGVKRPMEEALRRVQEARRRVQEAERLDEMMQQRVQRHKREVQQQKQQEQRPIEDVRRRAQEAQEGLRRVQETLRQEQNVEQRVQRHEQEMRQQEQEVQRMMQQHAQLSQQLELQLQQLEARVFQ